MNFNPDLEGDDDFTFENSQVGKLSTERTNEELPSILNDINKQDVTSMSNLMKITLSHMEDDIKCREEISTMCDLLNATIPQMSIKELTEYYKAKLREREFHIDCVLKVYNFVQKTELAREMLIGSDRKERVIEAVDQTKINKLLGMLNLNTGTNSEIQND